MTEEKKSHWQFLANLLGADPPAKPELPSEPSPTETEAVVGPVAPPPRLPEKPRAPRKTPVGLGDPGKHWNSLASELGLEVEPPPDEGRIEAVSGGAQRTDDTPESPASDSRRDTPQDRRHGSGDVDTAAGRPSPGDRKSRRPERRKRTERSVEERSVEAWRDDPEERPEDDQIEDEVRAEPWEPDDTGDVGDTGDEEQRPRKRRPRRRRRRSRDRSTSAPTSSRSAEVDEADDLGLDPELEQELPDETPAHDRSRRPRSAVETDDLDHEVWDATEAADVDDEDDDEDEPVTRDRGRRQIPSWFDAINVIVSANLEHRSRQEPRRHAGRRRRRER